MSSIQDSKALQRLTQVELGSDKLDGEALLALALMLPPSDPRRARYRHVIEATERTLRARADLLAALIARLEADDAKWRRVET